MTPQLPTAPGAIPFPENPQTAAQWEQMAHVYLEQLAFYNKVVNYLNAMANYKLNSEQRIGLGLPPQPIPVPPDGYTPPVPPPVVKPPAPSTVVRQGVADVEYGVIYPAPGDPNPDGTVIDNPFKSGNETIKKIVMKTIFGDEPVHFWIDNK